MAPTALSAQVISFPVRLLRNSALAIVLLPPTMLAVHYVTLGASNALTERFNHVQSAILLGMLIKT